MLEIQKLRQLEPKIIAAGSYPIFQAMLDYDFLIGRTLPSLTGIIASGKKYQRLFFGQKEILIPVFQSPVAVSEKIKREANLFLNVSSGRRVLASSESLFAHFPNLILGTAFAEDVPEIHALTLGKKANEKSVTVIGPASVGIVVPGYFKLGAVGGVNARQIVTSGILHKGEVAVLSASGGMVNEIINVVTRSGQALSFALSFGGDRFPVLSPEEAFLAAEADPNTHAIVYYGELGGQDEYELVELLKNKKVTKKVVCYIAGVISDLFDTPVQFGHAKAMAETKDESASSKRKALLEAGAMVAQSFSEFVRMINDLGTKNVQEEDRYSTILASMDDRKSALFASSISKDENGDVMILGEELTQFASGNSFAKIASSLFLGKKIGSPELEKFVDFVLRISVDHGPYVSGAVNTMITARAGRDLVSSLAAGLLTIGPRFGGAVNEAARNWLEGALSGKSANEFVEEFASKKIYIQGIGHRKYRIDLPDPRVAELKKFEGNLGQKKFLSFALEVEKITTAKKGNLILNVDGTIAAVMLDILSEKEGYSDDHLKELVNQEFFNALFVLSRSVGFIAHFLDQKRLDEGLFRLEEKDVAQAKLS